MIESEFITDKRSSPSVETNRAASAICKRLFPTWACPPTQGELQRIIIDSLWFSSNETAIKHAGEWWLWLKNLFIENTMSKTEKNLLMKMAAESAALNRPIHFVTARSPELLHAQVEGQGDKTLPRSRKAISTLAEIALKSGEFLPTKSTVIFADLAIDNIERIKERCNLEDTISENIGKIEAICFETGLKDFEIRRMSQLPFLCGNLSDVLNSDGSPKLEITLDERAKKLIAIVTNESFESHQRMFGWTKEQSLVHNTNLGITMGTVGQAVQQLRPPAILIHNESFIARGVLNNLFTGKDNPVPVICLRNLLESKKGKA